MKRLKSAVYSAIYNRNKVWLWLLLLSLVPALTWGQEEARVRIITELNPSSILIGEQTSLNVRLVYPTGKSAQLILPNDTLVSGVEIISSNLVDSLVVNDDLRELVYDVVITSFDSATYQLEHVQAMVGGELFTADNLPSLMVNTVPVDLQQPEVYADIKEQWNPPFVWQDYLIYLYILLGLLVLAAIIYFVIRWWRSRKVDEISEEQTVPEKDPYLEAIERIELLKASELWEQNQVKAYYTELSDILRRYLWRVYGMNTHERTTSEILEDFRHRLGKDRMYSELFRLLQMADLAKFAKYQPAAEENIALLNASISFVEEHKPKVEEESEDKNKAEESKEGGETV